MGIIEVYVVTENEKYLALFESIDDAKKFIQRKGEMVCIENNIGAYEVFLVKNKKYKIYYEAIQT